MVQSVLVANRGEIAARVFRTAERLGLRTIAVFSDADAGGLHVRAAHEAIRIGPAAATESYLNIAALLDAARSTGADAVHPGYGFLSENPDFAQAVIDAGLVWIGPRPDAIRAMGRKDEAKAIVSAAGAPVVPGYQGDDQSLARLQKEADAIGYPVLVKAVAGGGGKGMRRVDRAEDFADALGSAQRESAKAFADDRVLIEKFIQNPRHIEVQVFGDTHGDIVHLFERDCSVQRRHQKVLEEAPAPGMTEAMRAAMTQAAIKAAKAVDYVGAGTVEFIVDGSGPLRPDGFWFMEMNTRLQVEHPVTEMITGIDLVEWQIRVAQGEALPLKQDEIGFTGHAIEGRLYAEDPATGFLPSIGDLERFDLPEDDFGDDYAAPAERPCVRVETSVEPGDTVTPHYDAMIAKLVASGDTREEALDGLIGALQDVRVWPVKVNAGFMVRCLRDPDFRAGDVETGFIAARETVLKPAQPGAVFETLAIAAVCARGVFDLDLKPRDPWDASDGFRLNAEPRVSVALTVEDARFDLILTPSDEGWRVRSHDEAVEIIPLGGGVREDLTEGEAVLEVNGVERVASFEMRADGLRVFLDGEALDYGWPNPEAAADALDAPPEIKAPMPGKVLDVRVSEGDAVEKGQTLVVLEAMKMEHALTAARDGVVEALLATSGDQVDAGAALVRLSTAG